MEIRRSTQFKEFNGHRLFTQKWSTTNNPKGIILITHGISEHSNCYNNVAEELVKNSWDIWGWDLPGHGKSSGQRGYIPNFDDFIDCLDFISREVHNQNAAPLVHIGHSMGGLITLKHSLIKKSLAKAFVLSSPALGIKIPVPTYKDMMARLILRLQLPITLSNGIEYNSLSRDPSMLPKYKNDPLRHGKVSAPIYLGMVYSMAYAFQNAHKITGPVLFQVAARDELVDSDKTKELFNLIPEGKKQMHWYPDSFHEIYHDLNRREVIDDLITFLRQFEL